MVNIETLREEIQKSDEDLEIGRYFHLTEFLDLLFSKKIKFKKISCFNDGQEGFYYNQDHIDSIKFSKTVVGEKYYNERINYELYFRTVYYASCWVLREKESNLMWNSYSDLYNGILLKTTIKSLIKNIKEETSTEDNIVRFYFGRMDYGWKKKVISDHQRAFGKNEAFIEEKEFRIVVNVHPARVESLISFPINLNNVIKKIIISPNSNEAFKYFLKIILEKEGIDTDLIIDSEIKIASEKGFETFIDKFTQKK